MQEILTLDTVTVDEVVKLLGSMTAKSTTLDFICSKIFSPLNANLANLSFAQGHFPTKLKFA